MDQMGDRIALLTTGLVGLNLAAPGAGAILTIFIAGLAIGAAGIVWISLLVRKALLLIAIVFAPVAMAGSSWDHTRTWVSKWASFVIALIISKVVLVVIFLLATAQVSAPIDSDIQSVSEPIPQPSRANSTRPTKPLSRQWLPAAPCPFWEHVLVPLRS